MSYSKLLGERLRNVRLQKGMSLHDVEKASDREFKTSALGAYERGERTIPIHRLQRLAGVYGVPLEFLIPSADQRVAPFRMSSGVGRTTINLQKLEVVEGPEKLALQRFLRAVISERGDVNGRVISIRADDFKAIACMLEVSVDALHERLDGLGLLLAAGGASGIPVPALSGTLGMTTQASGSISPTVPGV